MVLAALAGASCGQRVGGVSPPAPLPVDEAMMCDGRAPRPPEGAERAARPRLPPRGSPARAVIQAMCDQRRELAACYSDALWRNPETNGRVRVHVDVRADGSVAETCFVDTTIDDREHLECIRARFYALNLPAIGARTRVVFPLVHQLEPPDDVRKGQSICAELREDTEAEEG